MATDSFTLFDTPIGRCGIVWGARGLLRVQLPEARELETRARLRQECPDTQETPPPPDVQRAVDGIIALLRGQTSDLSFIALDIERLSPFRRRVYEMARTVPPGATLSYGELAARLGTPGAARAVGRALADNPFAIVVPCHRVLAGDGKLGGFSANGGITTKLRLLSIEGAQANGQPALFDGDGGFGFDPDVALEHLRAADRSLARLIDRVGPFRLRLQTTPSIFVALTEAIVYQQLTGKAAATIFARLCALFPRALEGPSPQQILRASDQRLRTAGLSRSKVLALQDLARKVVAGKIPTLAEAHRLEDEVIIERLTDVRGIGRWTVEMLLIFRLGRPDVLPVDDYGVRKGFATTFRTRELPSRSQMETRGTKWRPYRTVASWYLWRAVGQAEP